MKEGFPYPTEKLVENVPDQGMPLQFIEWLSDKPEIDQSHFLGRIVKFKPDCLAKLIEFTKSADESVRTFAYRGLLYTPYNLEALRWLIDFAKMRIDDFSLEEGDWPLHFILDFIVEEGGEEGLRAMFEIEEYAGKIQDLNIKYVNLISRIMKNIRDHYSNASNEDLPDYISKFTNLLKY